MSALRNGRWERLDSFASRLGSGASEDSRVTDALKEYLSALEAGQCPDRRDFLARHPAIAVELARRLENLEFLEAAVARLRPPLEDAAGGGEHGLLPPGPLGDFRIVRVIGRGGMGIVYEAEQLSLNRRVALKVLPFAAALDPKQLQRFKSEAQAAAQLHHTNIVPVYAVGCERGVHYYAMQYIEGQSLAAVIKELRQLAGSGEPEATASYDAPSGSAAEDGPRELLSGRGRTHRVEGPEESALAPASDRPAPSGAVSSDPEERGPRFFRRVARLGMRAAEALDHAHQLGVVHRDIKPANLLLDINGNLWVTDFGLALFHNSASLTLTGEVVGTLRYMSPEQAQARRGVVDHRTDIYSLGATLYELLTLQPVFTAHDRPELMHRIAFDEPRRPRHYDRRIPPELETIVLKALAKDAAERYATAQDLADDLERFLQDRPVLARRPTFIDAARKWAWRHRSLVACGLAMLVLVVVASLVSTCLIAREHFATRQAYERERLESLAAQEQRARAEQSFLQARRAVDFYTRLGEEEMPNAPALNGVRQRMLEAALAYYQEFIDQAGTEPRLQAELAASRHRVEGLLGELSALQGTGRLMLLGDAAVQNDLELSSAQRARVKQLSDDLTQHWRETFHNFGAEGPQARHRSLIDLARSSEAALPELLSADQGRRLHQICLQSRAPHSFSSPEVVEALQLTSTQREHVRGIQDDLALAKWNCFQGDADHTAARTQFAEMRRNACTQILHALTDEQRAAWRNLTGMPFQPAGE